MHAYLRLAFYSNKRLPIDGMPLLTQFSLARFSGARIRCAPLNTVNSQWRVAHYRKFLEARDYTSEVTSPPCKNVRTFKTWLYNLFDFRLKSLEWALIGNELMRMRVNEKLPTENTRSPSALLRYVLTNSVLTAADLAEIAH